MGSVIFVYAIVQNALVLLILVPIVFSIWSKTFRVVIFSCPARTSSYAAMTTLSLSLDAGIWGYACSGRYSIAGPGVETTQLLL